MLLAANAHESPFPVFQLGGQLFKVEGHDHETLWCVRGSQMNHAAYEWTETTIAVPIDITNSLVASPRLPLSFKFRMYLIILVKQIYPVALVVSQF